MNLCMFLDNLEFELSLRLLAQRECFINTGHDLAVIGSAEALVS